MEISNTKACFVELWQCLASAEQALSADCRRFCVRNILRLWVRQGIIDPLKAAPHLGGYINLNDYIWDICRLSDLEGYQLLLTPSLYPRQYRELLRAIVAVMMGIGMRGVNLKALDEAYSEVFPCSTPLNVNKKKRYATR